MKHLLLASSALFLITGAVAAADLPYRKSPPLFLAPTPAFTWSGFYAGLNGGGAFEGSDFGTFDEDFGGVSNGTIGNTRLGGQALSGVFGGGQIGYNYQFSSFVLGVEAEFEASGISAGGNTNIPRNFNDTNNAVDSGSDTNTVSQNRVDAFGSVRGRIGYAFDRVLVYATGGFAFANVSNAQRSRFNDNFDSYAVSASTSGLRTGYAVGGGLEYAFADHWTIKGEYLYYDLGSKSVDGPEFAQGVDFPNGSVADGYTGHGVVKTNFNTLKVGLNYKF